MRTGAIVQARTSSTRLPGKVLKELPYGSRITVLGQVIRRLKQSKRTDLIVVATTEDKEDDPVVAVAEKEGVVWFRGSRDDVLSRYYHAAKENGLDVIVRVTSDCPCIDPEIVDSAIDMHLRTKADYTSNIATRTFPRGLDAEVMSFDALEKAHAGGKEDFEREHVTPYIYMTKPEEFKISSLEASGDLVAPDIRVTLDTEEDYAALCVVFDYLYGGNEFFVAKDIANLFREKPWLGLLNGTVLQRKVFDSPDEEMQEAIRVLELHGLNRALDVLKANLE
jgi:spore coat polysaccharide biosynthesis protein SpsF